MARGLWRGRTLPRPCVLSSRHVPGLGSRRKHQQGRPEHAGTCREPHHLPGLHHPRKDLGRSGVRGAGRAHQATCRPGSDAGQSSRPAPLSPLRHCMAPASVGAATVRFVVVYRVSLVLCKPKPQPTKSWPVALDAQTPAGAVECSVRVECSVQIEPNAVAESAWGCGGRGAGQGRPAGLSEGSMCEGREVGGRSSPDRLQEACQD